jgi:hypothetical protein
MTLRILAMSGTLALLLLLPMLASAQGYGDNSYSQNERQSNNRSTGSTSQSRTISPDWTSSFGSRGAVAISGDLSLSSTSGEQELAGQSFDLDDQLTFEVDPTFEYFVVDQLALVGTVDVEYTSAEGDDSEASTTTWGPSVGAAYYLPVFPNGALYGRVNVGYGFFSQVQEAGTQKQESEGGLLVFGGGAGILTTFGGKKGGFIRFGVDIGRVTGEIEREGLTQDIEYSQTTVNGVVGLGFYLY